MQYTTLKYPCGCTHTFDEDRKHYSSSLCQSHHIQIVVPEAIKDVMSELSKEIKIE